MAIRHDASAATGLLDDENLKKKGKAVQWLAGPVGQLHAEKAPGVISVCAQE